MVILKIMMCFDTSNDYTDSIANTPIVITQNGVFGPGYFR